MNLMVGTNNIFKAGGSCLLSELRAGVYCRSVMGGSNNTLCGLLNSGIFAHSTEWWKRREGRECVEYYTNEKRNYILVEQIFFLFQMSLSGNHPS